MIRVASIPADHPYVRHLSSARVGGVIRLLDASEPWWPPIMLDEAWIDAHANEFDIMHVHFGFDALSPDQLESACRMLGVHGKPLVLTAHDLRNPHHLDSILHDQQLDVLMRHAVAVITLTQHAATSIHTRFGVGAQVLAHPHIVEFDEMARRQHSSRSESMAVGLHLKSLRPNIELGVIDAAVAAVRSVRDAILRIDIHLDVARRDGARHDPELMDRLRRLASRRDIDLFEHDYFDDRAFDDYLASLRVSILPYRFGTHSGWLEACRDLGVAVVAPDCGAYREQGSTTEFRCNEEDGIDLESCTGAIVHALQVPPPAPIPVDERRRQRTQLAISHRQIYRKALTTTSRGPSTRIKRQRHPR